MMVIDHLGYRLLAMTLLPIDHDTLVYGSPDGGKTVTCSDRELPGVVDEVAQQLHLKEHVVGPRGNQLRTPLPCDVEIHRGTDGRRYCVDVARLFPPEPPKYAGVLLRRCGGLYYADTCDGCGARQESHQVQQVPPLVPLAAPRAGAGTHGAWNACAAALLGRGHQLTACVAGTCVASRCRCHRTRTPSSACTTTTSTTRRC